MEKECYTQQAPLTSPFFFTHFYPVHQGSKKSLGNNRWKLCNQKLYGIDVAYEYKISCWISCSLVRREQSFLCGFQTQLKWWSNLYATCSHPLLIVLAKKSKQQEAEHSAYELSVQTITNYEKLKPLFITGSHV